MSRDYHVLFFLNKIEFLKYKNIKKSSAKIIDIITPFNFKIGAKISSANIHGALHGHAVGAHLPLLLIHWRWRRLAGRDVRLRTDDRSRRPHTRGAGWCVDRGPIAVFGDISNLDTQVRGDAQPKASDLGGASTKLSRQPQTPSGNVKKKSLTARQVDMRLTPHRAARPRASPWHASAALTLDCARHALATNWVTLACTS